MAIAASEPAVTLTDFYAGLFHEDFFVFSDREPYFQEKVLQIAWNEQLFQEPLQTLDGRRLEVVHPGVWNVEAGPDFRDAVLFHDGRSVRGPVEVHRRPSDWRSHGHQDDAGYADVVLHVVWDAAGSDPIPETVPCFVVREHLAVPIQRLVDDHSVAGYPYARQVPPGAWAGHFAELDDAPLTDLLQSYGLARLLTKARQVGEQVEAIGLDAAAYQLFADAMGYKNNRAAFAKLTAMLPLSDLQEATDEEQLAWLFGAAGLLPDPSRQNVLPRYEALVRRLWDLWWSRRDGFAVIEWNRRQRPYNAPERRLLALWLMLQKTRGRPGRKILDCIRHERPRQALAKLRTLLQLDDDDWQGFYSFERQLKVPAALLGGTRMNDFLVNVAVPLYFAWCLLHNRADDCRQGRELLLAMPRLQSNRRFKEAVHFLFVPPSRSRSVVTNACAQQGLLGIYDELTGWRTQ